MDDDDDMCYMKVKSMVPLMSLKTALLIVAQMLEGNTISYLDHIQTE